VRYQKDINNIIFEYYTYKNELSLEEVSKLVSSSDSAYTIIETIKRYITIYMFLSIGYNYTVKQETYMNNVVEFTKNQNEYPVKINNFFNSESNSTIIKYFIIIKQVLTLFSADTSRYNILKVKPEYSDTVNFLNSISDDVVREIKMEKNKEIQCHIIIKYIIYTFIYFVYERNEFFKLMELADAKEGEYIFLDVIVSNKKKIDVSVIEKLIEGKSNSIEIYNIMDYIKKYSEKAMFNESNDDKIKKLIYSKIVIPITDEFLLYHHANEKYISGNIEDKKQKEETKLLYIVNKIETATNFYELSKNEKNNELLQKIFYKPMMTRNVVLNNYEQNMILLEKYSYHTNLSPENMDFINNLKSYMIYPYIPFRAYEKSGFSLELDHTCETLRLINFKNLEEKNLTRKSVLQTAVASENMSVNIVGFAIPTNRQNIKCIHVGDMKNIKKRKNNTYKNGYESTLTYLYKKKFGLKKHKSSYYWLFDEQQDKVSLKTYEQTANRDEHIKNVIGRLYDDIIEKLYLYIQGIIFKLNKNNDRDVVFVHDVIYKIMKNTLQIEKNTDIYNKLLKDIYTDCIAKITPSYDKNDDKIFGLFNESKQKEIKKTIVKKIPTVRINIYGIDELGEDENKEKILGICQHNIDWDNLSYNIKKNTKNYTDAITKFIYKYVIENADKIYVCNSCGMMLNIMRFILDGVYNPINRQFDSFVAPVNIPIEDIHEYSQYKNTILMIDKNINKIATVCNINQLRGIEGKCVRQRRNVTKNTIDIVMANNNIFKKGPKTRSISQYGISKELSNLFVFDMDNTMYVISSKDKDYYKSIKQNNIICYIIILLMLDLNSGQIMKLGNEKQSVGVANYEAFETIYEELFKGLKIRVNTSGDVAFITEYKVLCYVLCIFINMIIKYSIWNYEYPDISKKQKQIMIVRKIMAHSIIDVLNSVLEHAASGAGKNKDKGTCIIQSIQNFITI
jgi:hypothetical protein